MTKVSVVISTYNGKRYLKQQLDSIRRQTQTADECILVDDHSTDGSDRLVQDYITSQNLGDSWHFFRNPHNLGFIRSFGIALSHATGDIIFFADQDDVWERNKIASMCAIMEKYPQIQSLCTGFTQIDADGKRQYTRNPILTENNGLILFKKMKKNGVYRIPCCDILKRNISMGCAMAIRRDLAEAYLVQEGLENIPHDWALNLLAALREGLYFWNCKMIRYRIHENNTIGLMNGCQSAIAYRIREYDRYLSCYPRFYELLMETPDHPSDLAALRRAQRLYQMKKKMLQSQTAGAVLKAAAAGARGQGMEAILVLTDAAVIMKEKLSQHIRY